MSRKRAIKMRMPAVAASMVPGATVRAGLRSSPSTWAASKSADAILLEDTRDGLLTRLGSLLRCWQSLEEIKEPTCTHVIRELIYLRIIAPKLMLQAVGQADVLRFELFVYARPFPELNDSRIDTGELAERAHIGPEAVRQYVSIAAVVLCSCDGEAVSKAIELLRIDRINIATALEQDLDDRPVWRFDRDMDLAWLASTLFQQPGNHVSKAGATMRELALSDPLTHVIAE